MRKPINFWTERDKRHREPYRLAQAQTMLDLFVKARGGSPETAEELGQFLEEERRLGGVPAGPIRPTPKAIAKGRTESPCGGQAQGGQSAMSAAAIANAAKRRAVWQ